ncbi:hypothetical protein [Flavobacterium faecale]|nr:hypothetical protein [Flavobacterium faecale]
MSKSNTSGPRIGGSNAGSSKTGGSNPNYPSTNGNPSGGNRGNSPKK